VCLRHSDVLAANDALLAENRITIVDLPVEPPTLPQDLPRFDTRTVAEGLYYIRLRLKNWLGLVSESTQLVDKKLGQGGKMREDSLSPLVYIIGPTAMTVSADDELTLKSQSELASCTGETWTLTIQWRSVCLSGPCSLVPSIGTVATEGTTGPTLIIAKNKLPAGATIRYTVKATQKGTFSQASAEASTVITVRVRDPIPVITGVSPGGLATIGSPLVLSALTSIDPESAVTGITSPPANLTFSWSCAQQDTRAKVCPPAPLLCDPPPDPVPCDASVVPSSNNILPTLPVNSSALIDGVHYIIALSLSRTASTLPTILRPFSTAFTATASTSVAFTATASHAPMVFLSRCVAERLGEAGACTPSPPLGSSVIVGERVATRATTLESGAYPLFTWIDMSHVKGQFSPSNLVSPVTDNLLVLMSTAFLPGRMNRFRAEFRGAGGGGGAPAGYAEIQLQSRVPPLGGRIQVEPSSGVALETMFELSAHGWTADLDALPLTYSYFSLDIDGTGTRVPLTSANTFTAVSKLPAGLSSSMSPPWLLNVGVEVSDVYGASSSRFTIVSVAAGPGGGVTDVASIVALSSMLDNALSGSGNVRARLGQVASVLSTLNAFGDACGQLTSPSSIPVECQAVVDERRALRKRVLEAISTISQGQPATPEVVNIQASILAGIISRPAEMDSSLVSLSASTLSSTASSSRNTGVSASDLSSTLGGVVDSLFSTSRLIQGGARRSGGTLSALDLQLMQAISDVSTVSLQQTSDDMPPVQIEKTAYTISSRRVSVASFQAMSISVNSTMTTTTTSSSGGRNVAQADFPGNLFTHVRSGTATPTSAEIMIAGFDQGVNPISGSIGPVVILQVRAYGSSSELPLDTLTPFKIQLTLPGSVNSIPSEINNVTGHRASRFGMFYDVPSSSWSPTGLTHVLSRPDEVIMATDHMSYFSVVRVDSGCDAVPRSIVSLDSCKVCAGDNSTCSGCDGIPNTGRDKLCSGHGQCGTSTCSCSENWFDIMCTTYCSDPLTCSGHGRCNPSTGRSCDCDTGWNSGGRVYPGPFCRFADEPPATPPPKPADSGTDRTTFILITVLPSIGGLFACIGLGMLYMYLRREKAKHRGLRKTIIEFTAPEAIVDDGSDAKAMVAKAEGRGGKGKGKGDGSSSKIGYGYPGHDPEADEVGWDDDGMPKASAMLSFAPTSGQLASAISMTTKTNIGQMSVERIDRRTKVMSGQIGSRKTMSKYAAPRGTHVNPMEVFGIPIGEATSEGTENDEDDVLEGETMSTWQISNFPEWLRINNNQPASENG
jgi:hypothetical protein